MLKGQNNQNLLKMEIRKNEMIILVKFLVKSIQNCKFSYRTIEFHDFQYF